jgi:hypothetical protein
LPAPKTWKEAARVRTRGREEEERGRRRRWTAAGEMQEDEAAVGKVEEDGG